MNSKEIKKGSHSVFKANFQEFTGYISVKASGQKILNGERLLRLIEKYFEMLLYLDGKNVSGNIFKIDGDSYHVVLNGSNESGDRIEIGILESENILKTLVTDFFQICDDVLLEEYLKLSNKILKTNPLNYLHKFALMNMQSLVFGESWRNIIRGVSESISLEFISLERNLFRRFIFFDKSSPRGVDRNLLEKDLIAAYHLSFKREVGVLIEKGHLINIISIFTNELNLLKKGCEKDKTFPSILEFILNNIAIYNNLFHTHSRKYLEELFLEYSRYIEKDRFDIIRNNLYFNPQSFELGNTQISLEPPDFSSIDENNISTITAFVIPEKLENNIKIKLKEATVEFVKIENLFDDPIFNFLDQMDLNINGLPLSYFSDSIGRIESCSVVYVIYDNFLHPHFEIENGVYKELDITEQKAKRGGAYFPFKDLIIDTLWEAVQTSEWPYQSIKKPDIGSNTISNFYVSYRDTQKKDDSTIHHSVHLITNFHSYIEARERYLLAISQNYFKDDSLKIRELVNDFEINSYASFNDFCYKLLEMVLKNVIELGGGHSLFSSAKGTPNTEKMSQIAIYSLLRFITEIKGIKLVRETVAADGSVDFAFFYTCNGQILTICVELKNAHNQNLEHGIQSQLPLYIRDIGRNEGIFIVLWFKNQFFNQPKKYDSVMEMEDQLRSLAPAGVKIKTLVIDCTKKHPPSNPKRSLK